MNHSQSSFRLESLEPRLLLSADGLSVADFTNVSLAATDLMVWDSPRADAQAGVMGDPSRDDLASDLNIFATDLFAHAVGFPFADDFDRASGTDLGPDWQEQAGDMAIVANGLEPTGTAVGLATVNGLSAADVIVSADVDVSGANKHYGGLVARYAGPGQSNMYLSMLVNIEGALHARIYRNLGGAWTILADSPAPVAAGNLRFEVIGTSLSLFLDDAPIASATDSSITAAGSVGVRGKEMRFDNFAVQEPEPVVLPEAPTGVAATDGVFPDKVQVSWNAVADALSYEVWRNTVNDPGTASALISGWTSLAYDDETVVPDVAYQYWVRAVTAEGTSDFSAADQGHAGTLIEPEAAFADDFDRASGTDLGPDWQEQAGDMAIVANGLEPVGTAVGLATVNGFSSADVIVSADVDVSGANKHYGGLVARYAGPGQSDMYLSMLVNIEGALHARIYRNLGGAWTILADNPAPVAAGNLRFEVIGASLSLFLDDAPIASATDSSISAAGGVGVRGKEMWFDNFSVQETEPVVLPEAPTGVTASDGVFPDKVQVSWNVVAGALGYEVWRNTVNDPGAASALISGWTSLAYDDETVVPDVAYQYWVRAVTAKGTSDFSAADQGHAGTLSEPEVAFADDFDRVSGTDLGADWQEQAGDMAIVANGLEPVGTAVGLATVNGFSSADVIVSADVDVSGANKHYGGLVARYAGPGQSNMYLSMLVNIEGALHARIYRNLGGAWTILADTPAPAAAGNLRFEVIGASLSLFLDDAPIASATDSSISAAGGVGVRGKEMRFDNFSVSESAFDGIHFTVTYTDSPGEGFLHDTLGQSRRGAFESALAIWSNLIEAAYPDETVTIVASMDSLETGVLASAGPLQIFRSFTGGEPDTWYPSSLANHLFGADLDPATAEVAVIIGSGINWYYGLDGAPGSGQFDLRTVTLHEVGHGLGFLSLIEPDGTWFAQDRPGIYDRFLEDGSGTALDEMATAAERLAAVTGGNLRWSGLAGTDGNGGIAPRLYAPASFDSGSSVSHLDESIHENDLMSPFYSGPDFELSLMELGMLADMGWTVSTIT